MLLHEVFISTSMIIAKSLADAKKIAGKKQNISYTGECNFINQSCEN